ncbi:MAG: YqaA family protein [Pseudomonadota bacterium]
MSAYLGLFFSAFLASTFLPAFSEVTLGALLVQGHSPWPLWLVATSGNTLGACVNWALGVYCRSFENHPRFPIRADKIERAGALFNRYGKWSLLFAWLPIVGDPLTFIAGTTRLKFVWFVALVGTGKGARYAVLILLAQTILE